MTTPNVSSIGPDLNHAPPLEEPGRAKWFTATTPTSLDDVYIDYFPKGLRATAAEMVSVEKQVRTQCDKAGLPNFDSLDSTAAKKAYQIALNETVQAIKEVPWTHETNIRPVPETWLIAWTGIYIQLQWEAIRSGRETARQEPEKRGSEDRRGTLSRMTFHLNINPPGKGGIHDAIAEAEIPAVRCVPPDRDVCEVKSYQLSLFYNAFEISSIVPGHILNLRNGELMYLRTAKSLRVITRQSQFEDALRHLLKNRENNIMTFYFEMESKAQAKAREAREQAGKRTKATQTPASQPEMKGGRTPPTRLRSKKSSFLTSPRKYQPIKPSTNQKAAKDMSYNPPLSSKFSEPSPNTPSERNFPRRASVKIHKARNSITTIFKELKSPVTSPTPIGKDILKARGQKQHGGTAPKLGDSGDKYERLETSYEVIEMREFAKGLGGEEGRLPTVMDETTQPPDNLNTEEKEMVEEEDDLPHDQEFLVAELARLQNVECLTQLRKRGAAVTDITRWQECCRFFQMDYKKVGSNQLVSIVGLKTKLHQYQAFGVFWQMIRGREVGGGFLADEMGLGKTLSFLAYLVVERQLAYLWAEVEQSRRNNDGRHLTEDQQLSAHGCPSGHERQWGWIVCPCVHSNLSARLKPKPGIRLALVPPNLIAQWRDQWDFHIDTREPRLGMRLAVAHPPAFPTDGRFDNIDARHSRNVTLLAAIRDPKAKGEGKSADGPIGSGSDTARPGQERVLLLTTAQQYKSWVQKTFGYEGYKEKVKHGRKEWSKERRAGIVFGIAMLDECHEDYIKGKGRADILAKLDPANKPFLWGYSGTPLPDKPRGLEGILNALEQHRATQVFTDEGNAVSVSEWDNDRSQYRLRELKHDVLDRLCKDFDQYVGRGLGYKDIMPDLKQRLLPFLETFMLRRTADTIWFGRPLLQLKPHFHTDVFVQSLSHFRFNLDSQIEKYKGQVESLKFVALEDFQDRWDAKTAIERGTSTRPTKLTFNAECQVEWHLRVLATFPYLVNYLARIGDNGRKMDFGREECMQWRTEKGEKRSPYWKDIDKIVQTSAKAAWLYQFIRENIVSEKNGQGQERKLVIITSFSVVGIVLKIFIEQYFPQTRHRVGVLHAGIPQQQRNAAVEAFADRDPKRNLQFIIGTPRLLGQGLDLTRAAHVVLMEPDYVFGRELQAYARVSRIGQRDEKTFSYRLVNVGSDVEEKIVRRAAERGEAPGKRLGGENKTTAQAVKGKFIEELDEVREEQMRAEGGELSEMYERDFDFGFGRI